MMKCKIFIAGFSLSLLFGSFILHADAATNIFETEITEDTVWTKAASPYKIYSNISIDSSAKLTIEPGTVLEFAAGAGFVVDGELVANGRSEEKIFLTSQLAGEKWNGITVSFLGEANISQIRMSNVSTGLFLFGTFATTTVSNAEFSSFDTAIETIDSPIVISDSSFKEGETAIFLEGFSDFEGNNLSADVVGDFFSAWGDVAIKLKNISTGAVSGSFLNAFEGADIRMENVSAESAGSALYLYSSDAIVQGAFFNSAANPSVRTGIGLENESSLLISSSTVKNFTWGGIFIGDESRAEISKSILSGNDRGIVILDNSSSQFSISGSSIVGNTQFGIYSAHYESVYDPFVGWRDLYTPSGVSMGTAKNNWWGDLSGPRDPVANPNGSGDAVYGATDYEPWLTLDPFSVPDKTACCSSVVFIPGLQASRLARKTFLGTENQLWEPNWYGDVEQIYLGEGGKSLDSSIYVNGVLDEVNFPIYHPNIYKSFITEMNGLVASKTISGWRPLPYDWRLDLNDIIDGGAKQKNGSVEYMIPEIEKLAANSKTGKVTIITHSNGGLVAKLLIKKMEEAGESGLIDKLIMVAAPQLGTPQALAALLHGYDQQLGLGFIQPYSIARKLGENMPGAYQLLPSSSYFEKVSDPIIEFDSSLDSISNFRQVYGDSVSTSESLKNFILGTLDKRDKPDYSNTLIPNILNSQLVAKAKNIHDAIDSYVMPENIKVIQIAGWGLDTLVGIRYYAKTEMYCSDNEVCAPRTFVDFEPIQVIDGDGTVVIPSADAMGGEKYYINLYKENIGPLNKNRNHKDILEKTSMLDFVKKEIENQTKSETYITSLIPSPEPDDHRMRVSVHSPVSIDLYDATGSHTGLVPNTDPNSGFRYYEEQIPNSSYLEFGEGKYIGFDKNSTTTAKMKGTGIGTFTVKLEEVVAGETISKKIYPDIPVFPTTEAKMEFTPSGSSALSVDVDGDKNIDFLLKPEQTFDPISYLTALKNIVNNLRISKIEKQLLVKRIDMAIKMIQKKKIKSVPKLMAGFLNSAKSGRIRRQVGTDDAQQIVTMLNQLLNNLSK